MATSLRLLVGALGCVVFILIVRKLALKREMTQYAIGLVVAALIYVGFAVAFDASFSWLLLEAGGVVLFSLVALIGLRGSTWALIIGWVAHTFWDVLLHKVLNVGFVPEWYPVGCLGFDLLLAVYIIKRVSGNSDAPAT